MVTVEGVGRRVDPRLDIWAAAEPVVARWIARELSPAVKAAAFVRDARAAVSALARLAELRTEAEPAEPAPPGSEPKPEPTHPAIWFFAGAAVSALGFALGVAFHLGFAR
jgi:ubiquinone biosynthesis protein